jgi:hypothetical protein
VALAKRAEPAYLQAGGRQAFRFALTFLLHFLCQDKKWNKHFGKVADNCLLQDKENNITL